MLLTENETEPLSFILAATSEMEVGKAVKTQAVVL